MRGCDQRGAVHECSVQEVLVAEALRPEPRDLEPKCNRRRRRRVRNYPLEIHQVDAGGSHCECGGGSVGDDGAPARLLHGSARAEPDLERYTRSEAGRVRGGPDVSDARVIPRCSGDGERRVGRQRVGASVHLYRALRRIADVRES